MARSNDNDNRSFTYGDSDSLLGEDKAAGCYDCCFRCACNFLIILALATAFLAVDVSSRALQDSQIPSVVVDGGYSYPKQALEFILVIGATGMLLQMFMIYLAKFDNSHSRRRCSFKLVFTFCVIWAIFATISWLFAVITVVARKDSLYTNQPWNEFQRLENASDRLLAHLEAKAMLQASGPLRRSTSSPAVPRQPLQPPASTLKTISHDESSIDAILAQEYEVAQRRVDEMQQAGRCCGVTSNRDRRNAADFWQRMRARAENLRWSTASALDELMKAAPQRTTAPPSGVEAAPFTHWLLQHHDGLTTSGSLPFSCCRNQLTRPCDVDNKAERFTEACESAIPILAHNYVTLAFVFALLTDLFTLLSALELYYRKYKKLDELDESEEDDAIQFY